MIEMKIIQVEHIHQGKLVAQYRKAANISQSKLAEYMHVSVHTVQRLEKEAVIKDPDRRRFLVALLGIPAAYMGLGTEQHKRETEILLFNDDPMLFIEDMVANRWRTHLMGGPSGAAQGMGRMVKEVERLAQRFRGGEWHQRVHTQLCLVYQLQGSVQGDLLHYEQALARYRTAFLIANELDDIELKAAIRVREAIIFMRQENPLLAIEHLRAALDMINGYGFPRLRGNILAMLSEAYAKSKQSQECWRSIGLASRVLEQNFTLPERSHRIFHASLVAAHEGVDALLLRNYDRAIRLIDKSLKIYNPTLTPSRARLLARKAEAYYGLEEVDTCTSIATEAITLAYAVGAKNTLLRVRNLYTTLEQSQWKKEPAVIRLGLALAPSE